MIINEFSFVNYGAVHQEILCESAKNELGLPKRFRSYTLDNPYRPLTQITLAISAQFSQYQVESVLKLHEKNTFKVIDAREEPHFFINGMAITVSNGLNNDANRGLSLEAIRNKNQDFVSSVKKQKTKIIINGHLEKSKIKEGETYQKVERYIPEEVVVEEAETEEEYFSKRGISYEHIPLTDHEEMPILLHIDEIIEMLIASFKSKETLLFHCRGGKGRSTHLSLMAKMILEAKFKSYEAIKADYQGPIFSLDLKNLNQREIFFKQFHRYCQGCEPDKISFKIWMENEKLTPLALKAIKK